MSQRIEQAVRALLRPRRPGRLGPLAALGPLGPTVGAADWDPATRWQGGDPPTSTTLLFESGLIDVINLGGGVLGASLYLGEALVDLYALDTDLNDDGLIDEQDRLWPVGLFTPASSVVPLTGDLPATAGGAGTSRVLSTQASRLGPLLAPASLFTGKLALFVQSLYGQGDSGVSVGLTETWPTVSVGDVSISYYGRNSDTLCTTEDYRFFLCSLAIGGTNLEAVFRELTARPGLSAQAQALRTWAIERLRALFPEDQASRNDPPRKDLLESIVLGLSTVSQTVHSTVTAPLPSAAWSWAYGSPLAYGWHANWDGSEATIVLITIDSNSFGAGSQTLRASISHAIGVDGAITWEIGASLVAAQTKKIENDFFVWVPQGSLQTSGGSWLSQMYLCGTAAPPGSIIVNPPSTVSGFVLGGRYLRGAWQSDTWSVSKSTDPYALMSRPSSACHGETKSYLSSHTTGNAKRHRLVVGGQTIEGFTLSSINFNYGEFGIASSAYTVTDQTGQGYNFNFPLCAGDEGTGWPNIQNYSIFDSVLVSYTRGRFEHRNTDTTGYSCSGSVAYVVAHDHCEAAFGVAKNISSASAVTQNSGAKVNLTSREGVKYTSIKKASSPPVEYSWSAPGLRSATDIEIITLANQSNVSTVTNGPQYTKIKTIYADSVGATTLGELASGTGTPGSGVTWFGGDLGYPAPWGGAGGALSGDWGVFCEAPFGVCSAGNREYDFVPGVLVSAVFGSRVGHGTPSGLSLLTDDGYPDGDSFVGCA